MLGYPVSATAFWSAQMFYEAEHRLCIRCRPSKLSDSSQKGPRQMPKRDPRHVQRCAGVQVTARRPQGYYLHSLSSRVTLGLKA